MRKLALLLPFLLVGCVATPVKRNFPEAPQEIREVCPDLQKLPDGSKFSDVVSTVSTNYGQYHDCRTKVDVWNEWYNKQKNIFESVK